MLKLVKEGGELLTNEEKYEIICQNNEEYDGVFYVAVKTTKIFCKPSCKARTPYYKNVEFFDEKEEAIEKGYRPCKRCRPDLLYFSPLQDTAKNYKEIIQKYFTSKETLEIQVKEMGVSQTHLTYLFQKMYNMTPNQYRNKLCVAKAKRLLKGKKIKILEVAFESGYDSIATFYRAFKQVTGVTPKKFREEVLQ